MITERSTSDYIELLKNISGKGIFPHIGIHTEAIPINSVEAIEYHKSCLNIFLQRLYRSKGVKGVAIIPVHILKVQFLKRYNTATDKKAIILDELKNFQTQLLKVNEQDYRLSKFLYEKIKIGQQDLIYNIPYSTTSYLKFRRYASLWDMLHYKVFLDRLLGRDYSTNYQLLSFDLKPTQIKCLFESLKEKYIAEDTELGDFIKVFDLYNGDDLTKIRWVHIAQNKLQVNKIGLIHLIMKLQTTFINNPKLYMRELYNFISERFVDYWNVPFSVGNLTRCNSDYYAVDKPNTPRVKSIKKEIETIISEMRKI